MNGKCYVVLSVREISHLLKEAQKSRKKSAALLGRKVTPSHCIVVHAETHVDVDGDLQITSDSFRRYRA